LFIYLLFAAQDLSDWATLVEFLAHFAGMCSQLDVHCLYACSRDGNWEEFQRVIYVANLERSQIAMVTKSIEMERYCHPAASKFAAYLRAVLDARCVTPLLTSPEHHRIASSETDSDDGETVEVSQLGSLSISDDGHSVGRSGSQAKVSDGEVDSPPDSPAASNNHPPAKRRRLSSSSSSSLEMPPPRPPTALSSGRALQSRLSLSGRCRA
jgi:hypothetical protein